MFAYNILWFMNVGEHTDELAIIDYHNSSYTRNYKSEVIFYAVANIKKS